MKYVRTISTLSLQELGKIERNFAILNISHSVFISCGDKYFEATFVVESDSYPEYLKQDLGYVNEPVIPYEIEIVDGENVVKQSYDMYKIGNDTLLSSAAEFWKINPL